MTATRAPVGSAPPTPTFVELPAMSFVGVAANFISAMSPDSDAPRVIPPLWSQYMARQREIVGGGPGAAYGLVMPLAAGKRHELRYLAGEKVTGCAPAPDGMERIDVPASRYASFTHRGLLSALPATMHAIFGVWLPTSGEKLLSTPQIEIYDARFNMASPDSEFDILLPVA